MKHLQCQGSVSQKLCAEDPPWAAQVGPHTGSLQLEGSSTTLKDICDPESDCNVFASFALFPTTGILLGPVIYMLESARVCKSQRLSAKTIQSVPLEMKVVISDSETAPSSPTHVGYGLGISAWNLENMAHASFQESQSYWVFEAILIHQPAWPGFPQEFFPLFFSPKDLGTS